MKFRSLFAALLFAASPAFAAPPTNLADWTCVGTCGGSFADGDITLSPAGSPAYGYVSTAFSGAENVSSLTLDPTSRGGGTQTNGSSYTSPEFSLAAGETLSLWFNYVSTDGKGYIDYSWARLVNPNGTTAKWLFTAESVNAGTGNVVPGNVLPKSLFDPKVIVNLKDVAFTTKTTLDPVNWSPLGASNGTCWKDNAQGCGFTGWLNSQTTPGVGLYKLEIGVVNWGDTGYDSGLAFDVQGLVATVPEPATATMMLLALIGITGIRYRRK
jgi:hypothetical protein